MRANLQFPASGKFSHFCESMILPLDLPLIKTSTFYHYSFSKINKYNCYIIANF